MIRIYSHPNIAMVAIARDTLRQAGLDCELRNTWASGASGELGFTDSWPELWLVRGADRASALALLDRQRQRESKHWQCRHCGDDNDGSFEICWRCGKPAQG